MRLLLVYVGVGVCAMSMLALASCESDRPALKVEEHQPGDSTPAEDERSAISRDIAALAAGKEQVKAEDTKKYDDAREALISRGSAIETTLIDHLRRADDWGIRLGIIEVLMATGTKVSVDHLIFCLDDDVPLVALRANTTLQEMTSHNEIPPAGSAAGDNGLPPVPVRPATDLPMDADLRLWTAWHQEHAKKLRSAWTTWWAANKDQITIK